jgi:hypothetical protein
VWDIPTLITEEKPNVMELLLFEFIEELWPFPLFKKKINQKTGGSVSLKTIGIKETHVQVISKTLKNRRVQLKIRQ